MTGYSAISIIHSVEIELKSFKLAQESDIVFGV